MKATVNVVSVLQNQRIGTWRILVHGTETWSKVLHYLMDYLLKPDAQHRCSLPLAVHACAHAKAKKVVP